MNMGIVIVIGMSSAYAGGYISDAFSKKYPMTQGLLCGICVLLAYPFVVLSFIISNNFWLSIVSYGTSYLFAEMWYGPCVSMFFTLFPSEVAGISISVFTFSGSMAGALANTIIGALGDHYDTDNNPAIAGRVLGGAVGVSYVGCAIPFIVGAYLYKRFVIAKKRSEANESEALLSQTQKESEN